MTTFQNLNLNPKILSALESKGYTTPTPIQLQSIPHILEKRDLLGIAQTGTGKTAAFSLPIIHNLVESGRNVKSGGMRTLILTPTRELASQIAANIELYSKGLNLSHAVIFGGVSENPQITMLRRGVDILIATPGRLLDLANQGYVRFMDLEIFVLDEADRMLDMGFINDIKKIISKIPQNRQTLLFSATMPETIDGLANSILKNPAKVEITPPATTVERINQELNFVDKADKLSLLKHVIKNADADSILVFSRTKHGADRIVAFLQKNSISVAAIHGNKSQGAREKALSGFRNGSVKILVATDIAARGIDVPSISHVINYDIPVDPESYVHRIGRTARAGKTGVAISFCDSSELDALKAIEKTIKFKIPTDETHPFHHASTSAAHQRGAASRTAPSNNNRSRSQGNSDRKPRQQGQGARGNSRPKEEKGTSILGFMGIGKKRPKTSDKKRSEGFGFGNWFKSKKSDSRDGERGERRERGERVERGERRERSERREGGERGERRGNSSFDSRSRSSDSRSSNSRRDGDDSRRSRFSDGDSYSRPQSRSGNSNRSRSSGNSSSYKGKPSGNYKKF